MTPQQIDGLSAIVDQYDLYVVDQWGVLHNGETAHPGAVEALQRMKAACEAKGGKVALLSNSGKRVDESYRRLEKLGFSRDLYDLCLTSGEQVYRGLRDRTDPFYAALGQRYVMFAWDQDRGIVEDCGLDEVETVEEADFILCAGTDGRELEAYIPLLDKALARNLPLVCANPDKVSVQPDGTLKICPGAIADLYEKRGGTVRWHGKPQRESYQTIRAETGIDGPGIGIGDSLAHDIAGATGAGLAGWFITGAIHQKDLPEPPTSDAVQSLGDRYNAVPTYFSERFVWS